MADVVTTTRAKPSWVDLMVPDPEAARAFYSGLFGWVAEPNPDPQFGGYAVAQLDGKDVAGIGPLMAEGAPAMWTVYIGTPDADATAAKVTAAGGRVIAPPMQVGPAGRMAVFQDPSGAVFGVWQPAAMPGFGVDHVEGAFGWAELSARGIEQDVAFYRSVFGWSRKTSPMGEMGEYTEWQLDGESVAGGMEMQPMVPAEVPSYWMVYFQVENVPAATAKAAALGARVIAEPMDYPGGQFSVLADPLGATFGLVI